MVALDEGDKAIVANIAAELLHQVVPEMIQTHSRSCPVGKRLVYLAGVATGTMACLGGGFLFKLLGA